MKGPSDRTKVVLRHLPHTISQSVLMEQIDARFSGRYNWFCFRAGKHSLKCQSYSRAYIDFKQSEDVIEFAEFFDGHVFVNEKGTQFKTVVEYAPSQRVPKQWSKKDGREGTILKDPEYLEFLEFVSKPVENLPSAEIQLERKEAERAGAAKEAPIVTPLMDFVRQKRAAKGGPRRSVPNGKLMRRVVAGASSSSSTAVKRGSEKKATSTMYVQRDSGKNTNVKEKSTFVKRDDCHDLGEEKVTVGPSDTGKKKIILLKGKEKEILNVTAQQNLSVKPVYNSGSSRQNQRHEGGGRMIRSILVNKDKSEQNQTSNNQEKDKRQQNGLADEKRSRNRNKDKPDRGVWTPLKRSDGSDESLSSNSQSALTYSAEGTRGEGKYDMSNECGVEYKPVRGGHFSYDNGSHKNSGRRGFSHNSKDADGSPNLNEGKPPKRGGYASHEKRVWVQKPSSGS